MSNDFIKSEFEALKNDLESEYKPQIKVKSVFGETKWISISKDQVSSIEKILLIETNLKNKILSDLAILKGIVQNYFDNADCAEEEVRDHETARFLQIEAMNYAHIIDRLTSIINKEEKE